MNKNLDGITLSNILYQELNNYLKDKEVIPSIVDISIGNNYASQVYSKMKEKTLTTKTNIKFKSIHFNKITYQELINYISILNNKQDITGIIIQLPLPDYLKEHTREILDTIIPTKDIDGLTSTQAGLLATNKECLIPCTVLAIETILKSYKVPLKGSRVAILNRSNLIGIPLTHLMLRNDATPTICHSKTTNLKDITNNSDILIVGLNKPKYITKEYLKEGSIIIDIGVHKENNQTVGDTDYHDIYNKVSLITPPIGGVGPMTICMLAYNSLKALYGIDSNKVLERVITKAINTLKHNQ